MKNLANHLLLFDAECPVCDTYSRILVKRGIIENDNRKSYQQELGNAACPIVNRQRAVNEIALINLTTGEVSYGAESIFKIYSGSWPILGTLAHVAPLMWALNKIYAFLSYNLRVIIPPTKAFYCIQPVFKLHYRIAYLFVTWFITSIIITKYAALLSNIIPIGSDVREYAICGGQILFQAIVANFVAKGKRWEYLANMMTISFAGALLLGLMLIAANWLGANLPFYLFYFMGVAGLMFLEHIRRSKILRIGWWLTASWVTYRLLILLLILN